MKYIMRLHQTSQFFRNAFLLTSSSVIAQVILLVAAPVIARLYTPHDFGISGVYLSVLGVMTVGCMFRYEPAIAASKTRREAAVVTKLSMSLAICTSLLLLALTGVAQRYVSHLHSDLRLISPFFYWVPIGTAMTGSYIALSVWAARFQEIRLLSRTKLQQAFSAVLVQLFIPWVHRGPAGLLVGQVAGQSGGAISLLRRAWLKDRDAFRGIGAREMAAAARRYIRFPTMAFPAIMLESLFLNAPLIVLTSLYGAVLAGWVTLASRVFFLPGLLVGRSLAQVFLGELAELSALGNRRALEDLFWRRLKQLSVIGIAICVVAAVLAPLLIPIVFGKEWRNAWVCAELLMPTLLGTLVASVFGSALDVLERQDLHLLRELGRTMLLLIAIAVLYIFRPPWQVALGILGVMTALAYVFFLWTSWWAIHGLSAHERAGGSAELGTVEM